MLFSVVASFSGIPDYWDSCNLCYSEAKRACELAELDVDETEPGESEYLYLATESGEPDPESFWGQWKERVQDLTASGIVDREAFDRLISDLGAFAEDVQTLGTLGGPANPIGIAPDVSFRCESQVLIECIRVTPLPDRVRESRRPFSEEDWERVRGAVLSVYGS